MTTVVLCSGGVDSATLATELTRSAPVVLCFVDYDQPAKAAERRSVRAFADRLGLGLQEVCLHGLDLRRSGEIPCRNAMLFTTALAAEPDASVIAMGIHAGTGYRDCSPEFVSLMQSVANFHSDGRTTFVAPFVGWSKREVYDLAAALDVRVEQLHSCETADTPCGACRSCADRALLG